VKTAYRHIVLWSAAVVLLSLLAWVPSAPAQPPDPSKIDKVKKVQDKHTDALLALPDVVGTATGLDANGQPVVKVFVKKAGVAGIPAKLDDVSAVVEVTGEIVARLEPERPAPLGSSSGSERLKKIRKKWYCTGGTLGARVTDNSYWYALSNNHVYALENAGIVGDLILQPARIDMTKQACGSDQEIGDAVIGNLSAFVPITFKRTAKNEVDAALALIQNGSTLPTALVANRSLSYRLSTETTPPALTMKVKKHGRTTGLTKGTVEGVNVTVLVRYDSGVARFINQVQITGSDDSSFSDAGDSGSLIVTDTGASVNQLEKAVALLFAGSNTTTFGNPIDKVLTLLGVVIDGKPPAEAP